MNKITKILMLSLALGVGLSACKKDPSITENISPSTKVTARIMDPTGKPIGGATVYLSGKAEDDATFSAKTNAQGIAVLNSPEGNQLFIAKMGTIFKTQFSINVKADVNNEAPLVQLKQDNLLKVLVILASAENLEDVLNAIGYTDYDTISIDDFRDMAINNPGSATNYLKKYSLVFSNCNGSEENQYANEIAPIFEDYVMGGGKIYGGHYNYMNLRYLYPSYYNNDCALEHDADSIAVNAPVVENYVGFSSAAWNSKPDEFGIVRRLNSYQQFRDLPPNNGLELNNITYFKIAGVSPSIPAVVENRPNGALGGKYVYTIYHNQDIIEDQKLLLIVKFILYAI